MGRKCTLFFDILLVLAAAAVCGTVAFLVRDLWALKNGK